MRRMARTGSSVCSEGDSRQPKDTREGRVGAYFDGKGMTPGAFMTARVPSFTDFLASYAPELLPGTRGLGALPAGAGGSDVIKDLPHATTIVSATCDRGVVMAGDRRATGGQIVVKAER